VEVWLAAVDEACNKCIFGGDSKCLAGRMGGGDSGAALDDEAMMSLLCWPRREEEM